MTDETGQAFLASFDERWDDYRKRFKAARRDVSEETVHDLRVSARRFLALLGIMRSLEKRPRVKKVRRFVKKQLDQLDQLHDAQVMLQEITERAASLHELDAFCQYLARRTKRLERKAHKRIRASRPSELKPMVKRIRGVAEKHSEAPALLDRLSGAVDEAHAATVEAFAALNPEDPATIHRVRIAFKKFRYMIETIRPLLPGYPEGYLERMHEYQDAMGRIRDTTVLVDSLEKYEQKSSKSHGPEAHTFDAAPAKLIYEQRLTDLIRSYMERKDEFNMFWRLAPDQPFPWEQSHDPLPRTTRNRRTATGQQQRSRRQPAPAHEPGPEEVPQDRTGSPRDGGTAGHDPDFPVPTGG